MKINRLAHAATLSLAALSFAPALRAETGTPPETGGPFDSGMIANPHITLPDDAVTEVVVLLSGADGWGPAEDALAQHLKARGAATIGLDLPTYLKAMAHHDTECIYLVSDIEELSRRVQKDSSGDYRLPVIAGRGAGGALALAIAAQTPASTIAATVAVDSDLGVALPDVLCTEAKHTEANGKAVYDLTPDELNNPIDAVFSSAAPADGQAHVADLAKAYTAIKMTNSPDAGDVALTKALDARLDQQDAAEGPLDLPIDPLPAKALHDTMAIFYSGDGGWRDIDQEIGLQLQQSGIPVVGVDSLRYFWHERQPQETADDLSRIIRKYRTEWGVKHVVLIGYSFGADILPASYSLLPPEDKASVAQISLMALSHSRDYVIHVEGWLGVSGDSTQDPTDDMSKITPGLIQCIYGKGDDDDACASQAGKGYELIGFDGDHHFDGNYGDVSDMIIKGLLRRIK